MVTLGISTNTRLVSIAIISQNQLIDYFTHLHKASWSPDKADKIVASIEPCVRQYCIKRVALSIPYGHYQTKEHSSLMEALQTFCTKNGIATSTHTPEVFETFCTEGKKKSKKEFMKAIATLFPELQRCYQKEIRNKNRYYYKLFEAVAVALLAEQHE